MVRLTADLILRSPQYFNAVKERELDLRGNKISVIENLGATEDHYDSLDLSDNEIVKLEGFPFLKRLSTLLINNNRIARINPNIGSFLPNLKTLVLANNRLINLADLDPLHTLPSLSSLSLLDNIVTKKPGYRLYLIHKLPNLRLLDFRKVKQKEREEAKRKFGTKEAEITARKVSASTFVPGEIPEDQKESEKKEKIEKKGPTPEQITAIKAAIATAQTLEEVARLEKALKSGLLPSELGLPDSEKTEHKITTENVNINDDKHDGDTVENINESAVTDSSKMDVENAGNNNGDENDQNGSNSGIEADNDRNNDAQNGNNDEDIIKNETDEKSISKNESQPMDED